MITNQSDIVKFDEEIYKSAANKSSAQGHVTSTFCAPKMFTNSQYVMLR